MFHFEIKLFSQLTFLFFYLEQKPKNKQFFLNLFNKIKIIMKQLNPNILLKFIFKNKD